MVTNASAILAAQYGTNPFATVFGTNPGTNSGINSGTLTGMTGGSATLSPTVAARVQQALAGQRGNIDLLNASLTSTQTRLSGLGQLQSALDTFEALAESLAGAGLSTAASTSSRGILTAVTSAAAKPGRYVVDVSQLAQGQVLNSGTQPTAGSMIGSGMAATVKLEWGTLGEEGFQASAGSARTITIDSNNNTLDGIAAALKEAGVNATVVRSNGGYALQVNGKEGATQTLSISVSGDAALAAAIGFDPERPQAGGMTQAQAAQDAIVTISGKEYRNSTNTIDDAIEGVTITLTGKGETRLAITQDSSQIAKNVAAFVDGYNKMSDTLAVLQDGALSGDQALSRVSSQLGALMRIGGAGASSQALADIGLSRDADGKLVLVEIKLKAAIADDPEAVARLFTDEGTGLADRIDQRLGALTAENGLIRRAQDRTTRDLDLLTDRRERLAQSLTAQAQALAQMYTIQEQMGGTGTLLDLLG
ncbi:flagellar filament capping protein FliD [Pseudoduganella sp. SL102]|uniref:flagellar filament capping protein FliD n=1 Tax=Pseudoduganella sp. SL102 TaxID=2995154 RepID=UPI00248B6E01|nr:flagellar filament capping protein FliD [Pseudoduganella sp. SL102]WBS05045.1 flagellar filament capping protein FliD [Pseudoduganella sp. SL102]